MSLMAKLFGGGSAQPARTTAKNAHATTDALSTLSEQIDMLEKKVAHFEMRRSKETGAALKLRKAGQDKAKYLPYLRRAKRFTTQIEQLKGQQENLESMRMTLEMAPMMQGTVAATKQTKDALRANAMDVDDMADIMDDTREEMEKFQELQEQMAVPMGPQMDDDELLADFESEMDDEAELELLGEDGLEDDMAALDVLPPSTAMPERKPKVAAAAADDDEAALANWAS